jgi:hypothetical protein
MAQSVLKVFQTAKIEKLFYIAKENATFFHFTHFFFKGVRIYGCF